MVSGFGVIDFVVVIASMLLAINLLHRRPKRLLIWLPTLISIDFFIPLLSQLTPGRLIPLIIGVWWLFTGRLLNKRPLALWLSLALVIAGLSTAFALVQGDSGSRPVIRSLNYLNLVIVCGFAWQFVRGDNGVKLLFQGLSLAGVIHGLYSIYQMIANRLGLPYRGIVYGASGKGGSGQIAEGGFRINGFADEPKRLGFVLMAGCFGLLFLALRERDQLRKKILNGLSVLIFMVSFLTYSTSYLGALVISIPLIMLLSPKSWKYGFGLAVVFLVLGVVFQGAVGKYTADQRSLLESRGEELEAGLDGKKVYRQEFFARDYLERNPETVLTGVGMGRYYGVFSSTYGMGAGVNERGGLMPLNSQFIELMFDTSFAGVLLVYLGVPVVMLKVRNRGKAGFLVASLLCFLLVQSFFVQSLPLLMFVTGAGAAMVWKPLPPRKSRMRRVRRGRSATRRG